MAGPQVPGGRAGGADRRGLQRDRPPPERLASIEALRALHARAGANHGPHIPTIVIPAGTCGQASGANDLIRATKREVLTRRLAGKIHLRVTGCHGFCQMEHSVLIEPQETFYPRLRMDDIPRIVDAVLRGDLVRDLQYKNPATGEQIEIPGPSSRSWGVACGLS